MSNKDTRYGFRVIKCRPEFIREYSVDSGTAVAIYRGDLVKADADGNVSVMAAASDDMIGAVMSCFDSNGKEVNYLAASTAGKVRVCTDPQAIYQVQFENGGTAPTSAANFDAADAIWTHAGSTSNGESGAELSETLAGDGNSAQFRILGLVQRADNSWGHNADVFVTPLEHAFNSAPAAI